MATQSVTLSLEAALSIQERLLVGLSAFAEIDRIHQEACTPEQRAAFPEGMFPLSPSAGNDEVEQFAGALRSLHASIAHAVGV